MISALILGAVCLWGLVTLVTFIGVLALVLRRESRQYRHAILADGTILSPHVEWCTWDWPHLRDRPAGGHLPLGVGRNGGNALPGPKKGKAAGSSAPSGSGGPKS